MEVYGEEHRLGATNCEEPCPGELSTTFRCHPTSGFRLMLDQLVDVAMGFVRKKFSTTISIGCKWGKHRSVSIEFLEMLQTATMLDLDVILQHLERHNWDWISERVPPPAWNSPDAVFLDVPEEHRQQRRRDQRSCPR